MLLGRAPGAVMPVRHLLDRRPQGSVFAEWIRLALWFGRGYLAYQPAADGQPLAGTLRNLANNMIGQDGEGRWVLHSEGGDTPITGDGDIVGTGYRVMALDEPIGDGRGRDRQARQVVAPVRQRESLRQSTRSAVGSPVGYLKVTGPGLNQDQADQLKAKWLENHGNRRGIAVLNATTEFQPLSLSPVDAGVRRHRRHGPPDGGARVQPQCHRVGLRGREGQHVREHHRPAFRPAGGHPAAVEARGGAGDDRGPALRHLGRT